MSFSRKLELPYPLHWNINNLLENKTKMEILFQSYTAYSRYIQRYDSLTSEGAIAVVQSHPPYPRLLLPLPHTCRVKRKWDWERECCTSNKAWQDGDKRYPGNEVDLEHNDYDVMCLDKMQHEKLLFYISLSFCFWVRSRFCFVFLVWGFVFPFRDLSFCFGFWVFDFACMLFFWGVLQVYFRVLSVCFVLPASRKTFSFFKLYDSMLYLVILVLVFPFWDLCFCFGIGFPFWVLWYVFSLSATIYLTAVCL